MEKEVHLSPAKFCILVFGGVRPLARLLGRTASSVSKWQLNDGGVPRKVHLDILKLAAKRGIELTANDLVFGRKLKKDAVAKLRSDNNIDKRINS